MAALDYVTIAAAQYPLDAVDSLFDWKDKIADWVAKGAATGADLLIFPEYASLEQAATLGLAVAGDLQQTLAGVAELAGERIAFHAELAKQHGVHILAGSGPVLYDDGRFHNAAQLVTPQGLIGEQTKAIMTPFERDWGIHGGEGLKVFDTDLGRIGIAICYDSEFPLQVRTLATAGVEILLVPSCTEHKSGYHRIRTGARARALENQIVVATSPTVGAAPWSPAVDFNTGSAGIYVPSEIELSEDGVLAEGKLNEPGWVSARVDLKALRALRFGGEMRNYLDWSMQAGADDLANSVGEPDIVALKHV